MYTSEAERNHVEARKRLAKKYKTLNKASDDEVEKFNMMRAEYEAENQGNYHPMIDQIASSAGDKYRVTLINISGVEHWFDPSQAPKPSKKKSILLVPCTRHIKVRDINLDEREWLRDFSYEDSNGEHVTFKQGDPIGRLMSAWVEALMKFEVSEREKVLGNIEIWGQPRAWTDEKISCDLVEFLREQWVQAIVFADCLGAQWTEQVLLRAWLENIIWAPYAPEVTSTLQECDTHEHHQLKAAIRKVKSELHWALEMEWWSDTQRAIQQAREGIEVKESLYPSAWGAFEVPTQ